MQICCDVALGEYLPTFRRCVVLSFTGSITAGEDVEFLIQMEGLRFMETSRNVYWSTSKGKGKVHPRIGHEATVSTGLLVKPQSWRSGIVLLFL